MHARRHADRLRDIFRHHRFGHHHGVLEAEGVLQFRLQCEAFRHFALDPDLDFPLLQGLVDVPDHGDAADAKPVSDLVLGQAFDIVHPCDPHAVARNASGTAVVAFYPRLS